MFPVLPDPLRVCLFLYSFSYVLNWFYFLLIVLLLSFCNLFMPFDDSILMYSLDFSIVKHFISKRFELHRLYERCYVNKFCYLFLFKGKCSTFKLKKVPHAVLVWKQVHEIQPLFTFSIKALHSLLQGNLMGQEWKLSWLISTASGQPYSNFTQSDPTSRFPFINCTMMIYRFTGREQAVYNWASSMK